MLIVVMVVSGKVTEDTWQRGGVEESRMGCAGFGSGTSHDTPSKSSLHWSVHRISSVQQGPRGVSLSIWYSLIGPNSL